MRTCAAMQPQTQRRVAGEVSWASRTPTRTAATEPSRSTQTAIGYRGVVVSRSGCVSSRFAAGDANKNKAKNKKDMPMPSLKMRAAVVAAGAGLALAAAPVQAQTASNTASIQVELNKLETQQTSCRAYLVVDNQTDKSYDALKLDLVLFQTDGIIGRRFALDLAPIKSKKRSVKLFDLEGVKCDAVGSFLINDIMDCKAGSGDETGCLERLTLSTRTNVQLSK